MYGTFFLAVCDKTLLLPVLARIPIDLVLNEDAPIWGAAYQALDAALPGKVPHSQRRAG